MFLIVYNMTFASACPRMGSVTTSKDLLWVHRLGSSGPFDRASDGIASFHHLMFTNLDLNPGVGLTLPRRVEGPRQPTFGLDEQTETTSEVSIDRARK